jgi:phospholipase C
LLGLAATVCLALAQFSCAAGGSTVSPSPRVSPSALPSPTIPPTNSPIKHVVIIFQENRTTDNMFHGLPGADTADTGKDSHGNTIPLVPVKLASGFLIGHSHHDFFNAYNGGLMNGFDREGQICPSPPCGYNYVPRAEVDPYFQMAEQYTFGDHMFQTNQGPSFPAHLFLISGTSEPSAGSNLLVSENPSSPSGGPVAGCVSSPDTTVPVITPSGDESGRKFPCFEIPTLMDLLDEKHVSWKYYAPGPDTIWTLPDAINHIRFGPDWNNVVTPSTKVLRDIAANQLPAVTWIMPDGAASDHPGLTDGSGPSWVASIVNALGQGGYWKDTAIFISWDDWGGFYDHVAPPDIFNSYELGFRVPLIVVSPYAKAGYVSKVDHEFGSILHYIENNYNLGSLGFTDARADDLSDCFDYQQTPIVFRVITAPLGPKHFLRPGAVHGPPDDD